MGKGAAYVMCFVAVLLIFCVMCVIAVKNKELSLIPVGGCLTALVSLTGGYIGFQVANNGVKGHWWNPDMYAQENNIEEELRYDRTKRKDAGRAGPGGPPKV